MQFYMDNKRPRPTLVGNLPHPKVAPDLEMAKVWCAPQEINAIGMPLNDETIDGLISEGVVVPIPNCPLLFAPQAYMSPSETYQLEEYAGKMK